MRKALFTVLLGGYDHPQRPPKFRGWDNVIFTDQRVVGWDKVISVEPTSNPVLESRRYKWLSHLFLPEYDQVCYFDANMRIVRPLPEYPFRIKHFKRNTVREEADACNRQLHRCTVESVERQMAAYIGFTDQVQLYLNGFFSRLHNATENALHELVFELVKEYTPRDQLALPYAMWKLGYTQNKTEDGHFFKRHIRMIHHKAKPKIFGLPMVHHKAKPKIFGLPMVHHITPGRSDKDFGKAINSIISALPDTDWICLRDIDTMPVYHEKFFAQCEAISKSDFGLVGCMTNRLGLTWQLHGGVLSTERDIMKHRDIAVELYNKHGSEVSESKESIAGMFMLFPKSTWTKVGGFPEGAIRIKDSFIDWLFWDAVRKAGLKVGIAKGIYVFHLYRMWNKSRKDIKHLI